MVEAVKRTTFTGSSTAVLAKLDSKQPNLLRTTNLGDSGYLLLHVLTDEANGPGEDAQAKSNLLQYFRSKE